MQDSGKVCDQKYGGKSHDWGIRRIIYRYAFSDRSGFKQDNKSMFADSRKDEGGV